MELEEKKQELKEFGNLLRTYRLESRYTQAQIGKILNVTCTQYGRFELGMCVMNVLKLSKLCQLYKISADQLLSKLN